MINLLVIGSGGREHALCWALKKSPLLGRLFCAPGNGGIAGLAECITLDTGNAQTVIDFCRDNNIGLVVIGPEAPLVAGLADALEAARIPAFGPSARAAQLEGSKGFTKDLCTKYNIPTAAYGRFSDPAKAKAYAQAKGAPIVIKADGLAAGKGVIIAQTPAEANAAIDDILGGQFGAAGASLVVEEFLSGEEASFFALVDGHTILPLPTAQDHKKVGAGDLGPNTGGMGAYSPAPVMTPKVTAQVMREIIEPTVKGMTEAGMPFKGVLFAGLMITAEGPKLIEYNTRFGDPECQVLMLRLKSDLLPALLATALGKLGGISLEWDPRPALTVVMAANGYPGAYQKGSVISGLEAAGAQQNVMIFHAGTKLEDGLIKANGGRVLNVTALAETVSKAQAEAYAAVDKIHWPEGFCRRDIGWRAIARE